MHNKESFVMYSGTLVMTVNFMFTFVHILLEIKSVSSTFFSVYFLIVMLPYTRSFCR